MINIIIELKKVSIIYMDSPAVVLLQRPNMTPTFLYCDLVSMPGHCLLPIHFMSLLSSSVKHYIAIIIYSCHQKFWAPPLYDKGGAQNKLSTFDALNSQCWCRLGVTSINQPINIISWHISALLKVSWWPCGGRVSLSKPHVLRYISHRGKTPNSFNIRLFFRCNSIYVFIDVLASLWPMIVWIPRIHGDAVDSTMPTC